MIWSTLNFANAVKPNGDELLLGNTNQSTFTTKWSAPIYHVGGRFPKETWIYPVHFCQLRHVREQKGNHLLDVTLMCQKRWLFIFVHILELKRKWNILSCKLDQAPQIIFHLHRKLFEQNFTLLKRGLLWIFCRRTRNVWEMKNVCCTFCGISGSFIVPINPFHEYMN